MKFIVCKVYHNKAVRKKMATAPLLTNTEIPLKFSLMVVCGINISGDIFMYITVGLWDTWNILLLMYNSKNFNRSKKCFCLQGSLFVLHIYQVFCLLSPDTDLKRLDCQCGRWSSWEVVLCLVTLDQTLLQEMNTWIISGYCLKLPIIWECQRNLFFKNITKRNF